MSSVLHDLRLAVRTWRRHPAGFALAVLALALGIGANLVVFGLVEALIVRPLPAVSDAGRVLVTRRNPFSYRTYRLFADRQRAFERTAAWQGQTVALATRDETVSVGALFVTGDYFSTLGVAPVRGRLLGRSDEERPGIMGAVISEHCWRTRFHAVPVLGRSITINRTQATIVGVAAGFRGTELGAPVDVFLPVTAFDAVRDATGARAWLPSPGTRWLQAVARLRAGVPAGAGIAEAEHVYRETASEFRTAAPDEPALGLVSLVQESFPGSDRDSARRVMITLLCVAACVLLIACANVANLLLARGEGRRLEWGVRLSLGATRERLARQLLLETAVLVGAASIVAWILAGWANAALSAVRFTANSPVSLTGALDLRVAVGAVGVAVLTSLVCGLVPAVHSARTDLVSLLGRSLAGGARRRLVGMREALVAAQVAVSVLLVVGAILFAASFRNQARLPPGFEAGQVAMLRANVQLAGYGREAGADFYRRLQERLQAVPGVTATCRALNEPLAATTYVRTVGLPGRGDSLRVMTTTVSSGYFRLLRIPIVDGRDFDEHAPAGAVIVNQTLARRLWPGRSAVGQTVVEAARDRESALLTVVGVARDSKYESLTEERSGFLYAHTADDYDAKQVFFARTGGNARALLAPLRQALWEVDSHVPVLTLTTLDEHVASSLARPKAAARLLVTLACLAVLIAGLGIYSVLSYVATTRRREMAVRLALGASSWEIASSLGSRHLGAVAAGLVTGLLVALLLERFVESLLYGVVATQAWVLVLTVAITLAVGVVAAAVPAARAMRTDPAALLRE